MRTLFFASVLCSSWQMAAAAEESCPQGPFETDREKIAASLASLPALPKTLGRERQSHIKPEAWTLTDGVASEGGGGLAPPAREGTPVSLSARVEYDPKGYVARYVRTQATLRSNRLADERYFTRTVRPTVEQARDIACLVNRLLNPPAAPPTQETAKAVEPRDTPAEIIVIAAPRPCINEYTDGHWESLGLRVGGAEATVSPALSCSDAGRIEAMLSSAVGAPFLPW